VPLRTKRAKASKVGRLPLPPTLSRLREKEAREGAFAYFFGGSAGFWPSGAFGASEDAVTAGKGSGLSESVRR